MGNEKIVSKEEFPLIRDRLKADGKSIVLCHGVFDLLHMGHINHFIDAKKQGDVLVVSITAARYVNKGPGKPFFDDRQRLEFVSNIEIVDYCMLSDSVTVNDIIEYVQPDIYAKGKEYEQASNDITGNISSEEEIVIKYGGKMYYTEGEVYSSTFLLNNYFSALSPNVSAASRELKNKYGDNLIDLIRNKVDSIKDISVLVIGDVIIDEYVFCNIQGVTMKDASLSAFYDFEERYTGGALAIAKHIAGFTEKVALCSMIGTEYEISDYIRENMDNVELNIIQDPRFTTPIKRRYLKSNMQRQEYDKLFSINHLMKRGERKKYDYTAFHEKIKELLPQYDVVIIGDFGHGLLDEEAISIIEDNSHFLAVNCQSNSANMGTNIITKYNRANTFVVDERELRLAFGQALHKREELLMELKKRLNSSYAWVTIGAEGAIGASDEGMSTQPALTLSVKDTVGAGDAFYSIAALLAYLEIPIEISTMIANAAGAIKAGVLGNREPVKKIDLLKFVKTVLNI